MKNLRTPVLCASLMLCSLFSMGQTQKVPVNEPDHNRPKLFNNLPEKIPFNPDNLLSLQNRQTGSNISISLSDEQPIPFEGTMVSAVSRNDGKVESIVVKSTNYNGATFSMSRVINDDGRIIYSGRLISFRHGDLYILQQSEGGYMLVKKNFYDLVNE
ncbi:MAG TPA: hypothetical protein VN451_10700 [Chitinophagaceae bacterium]|nr:hypothetical protein [Chitinophagaceae bacterium]